MAGFSGSQKALPAALDVLHFEWVHYSYYNMQNSCRALNLWFNFWDTVKIKMWFFQALSEVETKMAAQRGKCGFSILDKRGSKRFFR